MSIRLKIASFWLPDFILKKELNNVARKTIEGLDNLLKQYGSETEIIDESDKVLKGNLKERRFIMAKAHNKRVSVLIDMLGYEKAVKIGRNAMFEVGYKLGQNARRKLGARDNFEDLELAASILYKILGINFKIENKDGNIIMIVNRCALSKYYSPESCMILSAADEGVVRGLNENMSMQFKERITDGASECMACINEVKL
ncbi:L-2-amino-thiazoline-4-carboxylic acid hydrolase [Methanobacterium sp.]|uniref:L-2-amino-thiazoline-4-carboxylic acid hydrolase n=1 Tax=Methanobacterium sp. TaxID=2164 RepID=UPI003C76930B